MITTIDWICLAILLGGFGSSALYLVWNAYKDRLHVSNFVLFLSALVVYGAALVFYIVHIFNRSNP